MWELHEILEICHTSTNGFSQFVIFCRDSLRWIKPRVLKNVTWLTCRWTDTKIPPTSTSKLRHKMGLQVGNISIIIKKILKNLDLSILNSHYPFIDAAPWRNYLISLPSKLCLLWHFFCTRVHATPLKNSLFLSFKTRI